MTSIRHLSGILQHVLTELPGRLARPSGFLKRQRKLSAAAFVQTLVVGWLAGSEASLSRLCQSAADAGVRISPQGLSARFGPEAAALLEDLLAEAAQKLVCSSGVEIDLLRRFEHVWLIDTSAVALPAVHQDRWPGVGGSTPAAGRAGLKFEVMLDLRSGELRGPHLLAGRTHDKRGPEAQVLPGQGELRVADLGYFSLEDFAEIGQQGGLWLSPLKTTCVLTHRESGEQGSEGERFSVTDLLAAATRQQVHTLDVPVRMGTSRRLPCRLIARRLSPQGAERRRRKLRRAYVKKGYAPSKESLMLCDWMLLVTNASPEQLSAEEALALYRSRWQVELLFKRFKQHGGVARSRSADPWRVLCEVYAKLLAMLLVHWVSLLAVWERADKSLVKAQRAISDRASYLGASMKSRARLRQALGHVVDIVRAGCRMNPRRKHPNTYQHLLNPCLHSLS